MPKKPPPSGLAPMAQKFQATPLNPMPFAESATPQPQRPMPGKCKELRFTTAGPVLDQ